MLCRIESTKGNLCIHICIYIGGMHICVYLYGMCIHIYGLFFILIWNIYIIRAESLVWIVLGALTN